jgi:anti-sigma factor RsiW
MSLFRRRKQPEGVDCEDFVELITDYLEDALPAELRARIDDHLVECPGCAKALEQWKVVVSMTGHLAVTEIETIDSDTRAELLRAFRAGDAG